MTTKNIGHLILPLVSRPCLEAITLSKYLLTPTTNMQQSNVLHTHGNKYRLTISSLCLITQLYIRGDFLLHSKGLQSTVLDNCKHG